MSVGLDGAVMAPTALSYPSAFVFAAACGVPGARSQPLARLSQREPPPAQCSRDLVLAARASVDGDPPG